MYKNRFSLRTFPGKETDNGYVGMRHGSEYQFQLRNDRPMACDAIIEIDGKPVGTWRIEGNRAITIERPAEVDRKFTFYKLGTPEGDKAGLTRNETLGLIKVTFIPEKERQPSSWKDEVAYRGEMPREMYSGAKGMFSRSAGGTGLGAQSHQQFGQAQAIDRDYSSQVIIHLRLVAIEEPDIIPLPGGPVSTPIPPPVY